MQRIEAHLHRNQAGWVSGRRAIDHPVAHKEGINHNAAKAALEGRCARKSAAEHAHTRVSLLWPGCWRDESDGRLVLVHEMDSARGSRHHVAVHTQAHEHTAPRARTTRRGKALHRVRCDVRAHHGNLAKVTAHRGSREVTAHQRDQRATASRASCRPERREVRRGEVLEVRCTPRKVHNVVAHLDRHDARQARSGAEPSDSRHRADQRGRVAPHGLARRLVEAAEQVREVRGAGREMCPD